MSYVQSAPGRTRFGRKTLLIYLPRSVTRQINIQQLIQNTFRVNEVYSTLLFQERIRHLNIEYSTNMRNL